MKTEKREINGKMRTVGILTIDFNDKETIETIEIIEILKLTFGEDLRIRNKCTKVTMAGNVPNISVDQEKLTLLNLTTSIIKAPFEITESSIMDLDKDIATEILSAFNDLNNPSEKKD